MMIAIVSLDLSRLDFITMMYLRVTGPAAVNQYAHYFYYAFK